MSKDSVSLFNAFSYNTAPESVVTLKTNESSSGLFCIDKVNFSFAGFG